MTPACRLLKSNKIEFSIHEYEHDANAKSFGLEAAEKLNLNVNEVFKTLLVTDEKIILLRLYQLTINSI